MTLTVSRVNAKADEPGTTSAPAGNNQAINFMSAEFLARMPFFNAVSPTPLHEVGAPNSSSLASSKVLAPRENDLASRMRLLIRNEGSMASIARRCGFSEGAVRSWRDGQSDISRERCVIMARTLNVSLIWLITGEGPMRLDPAIEDASSRPSSQPPPSAIHPNHQPQQNAAASPRLAVDSHVLADALRLLQSYVGLLGGSLNPVQRADVLAELYDILRAADQPGHIDRLIAFHTTLSGQLRRANTLVA